MATAGLVPQSILDVKGRTYVCVSASTDVALNGRKEAGNPLAGEPRIFCKKCDAKGDSQVTNNKDIEAYEGGSAEKTSGVKLVIGHLQLYRDGGQSRGSLTGLIHKDFGAALVTTNSTHYLFEIDQFNEKQYRSTDDKDADSAAWMPIFGIKEGGPLKLLVDRGNLNIDTLHGLDSYYPVELNNFLVTGCECVLEIQQSKGAKQSVSFGTKDA